MDSYNSHNASHGGSSTSAYTNPAFLPSSTSTVAATSGGQGETVSPYEEYLHSSLFAEDAEPLPDLEFDEDPAAESFVAQQSPLSSSISPASFDPTESSPSTAPLHPNQNPPAHSQTTTAHLTDAQLALLTPADRNMKRKPTGFRGSTPSALISIDAPIQPRSYVVASSTSRKRKTSAVVRKLAKRRAASTAHEGEEGEEGDGEGEGEEIPNELLDAAERKRLQNTLSARKSRLRKQMRVAELEEEVEELKDENGRLEERVRQLELLLGKVGVSY